MIEHLIQIYMTIYSEVHQYTGASDVIYQFKQTEAKWKKREINKSVLWMANINSKLSIFFSVLWLNSETGARSTIHSSWHEMERNRKKRERGRETRRKSDSSLHISSCSVKQTKAWKLSVYDWKQELLICVKSNVLLSISVSIFLLFFHRCWYWTVVAIYILYIFPF